MKQPNSCPWLISVSSRLPAAVRIGLALSAGISLLWPALPISPAAAQEASNPGVSSLSIIADAPFQLAEAMTIKEFLKQFLDLAQAQDAEGLRRLINNNVDLARETQRSLLELAGTAPEQKAKLYRTYAEIIGTVLKQAGLDSSSPSASSSLTTKEFLQKFIDLAKSKDKEGMRRLAQQNKAVAKETAQNLLELAKNKSGEDAQFYRDFAQLITRMLDQAEDYVVRSPAPTPPPVSGSADTSWQEGKTLFDAQRYQEALPLFQAAVRSNPNLTKAHYFLGMTYRKLNRDDEALESFRETSRLNPQEPYSHYYAGLIYLKKDRLDAALAEMQKARDRKNDDSDIHYYIGITYKRMQELDKALASFHRAEEVNSQDPDIFFQIGNLYLKKDKQDMALIYYRKTTGLKKDYADAHFNIGVILERRNNYKEAIEAFENYLKYAPNASDVPEVQTRIQKLRSR